MTDHELQFALRALGRRLEGDERPGDLAARVLERLPTTAPAARRSPSQWWRPALIAAVLLLIGAATAVAASDSVRSWLHFRGIDATPVETLPATVSVEAIADLGAGSPVDAATARSVLGHRAPRSPILGTPAAILATTTGEPSVTLAWRSGADLPSGATAPTIGALLTIVPRGDPNAGGFLAKALGGKTHVEFVDIPGFGPAVWIAGAPHAVTLFDGTATTFRLASNVLVWSAGGDVMRFESALDRADAVAVAGSFAG